MCTSSLQQLNSSWSEWVYSLFITYRSPDFMLLTAVTENCSIRGRWICRRCWHFKTQDYGSYGIYSMRQNVVLISTVQQVHTCILSSANFKYVSYYFFYLWYCISRLWKCSTWITIRILYMVSVNYEALHCPVLCSLLLVTSSLLGSLVLWIESGQEDKDCELNNGKFPPNLIWINVTLICCCPFRMFKLFNFFKGLMSFALY
jgi:hypothetical protein